MGINLWILYHDLATWNPGRSHLSDTRIHILEYFKFYRSEEAIDPTCLYLVGADDLPDAFNRNPDTSFLCIGIPNSFFASIDADIIWIPEHIPEQQLVSALTSCFHRYQRWHAAMIAGIRAKKPLDYFLNLSLPLFRNPICLFSSNFMSLAFAYDEKEYGPLPQEYVVFQTGTYINEEVMQEMESGGDLKHSLTKTVPYLFTTNDEVNCLCTNIWVMGRNIAILEVDEFNTPLTERDYTLIYILSLVLQESLEANNMINFSLQSEFKDDLIRLLEGKTVPASILREDLNALNWQPEDRYSCLVFQSLKWQAAETALWINGETLIHTLPGSVYVIYGNDLILICNRSRGNVDRYRDYLRSIRDKLVNISMVGGVSNDYVGFDRLYHFINTARQAAEIGQVTKPGQYLYYFEDLTLDIFRQNCLKNSIPEVYIPPELLDVIAYDEEKGSDYRKVLYSLLKNNMSPTDTAAELYMHRNTIINRLGQLKTKFNMDLDNFDYRFKLTIALHFLNQK